VGAMGRGQAVVCFEVTFGWEWGGRGGPLRPLSWDWGGQVWFFGAGVETGVVRAWLGARGVFGVWGGVALWSCVVLVGGPRLGL